MAICRVYLLTYRRHALLPRALASLLNQTFTDWVCELHNDDPDDRFPQELVKQMDDPRITVINHSENWGATRSFNHVFQPTAEPFISLLEDDNWWEPTFLETMIAALKQHSDVQVAWANMQLWQEQVDGSWHDTGRAIWPRQDTNLPEQLNWGQPQQMVGALHSNGAMMLRSPQSHRYCIPDHTPFEAMEAVRERTFSFPILFVPQVLANFAMTRTSSRSNRHATWAQMQTLLTASFLKHRPMTQKERQNVWQVARSKPIRPTTTFFFAALSCPHCRSLLRYAAIADWWFFALFCLKHPLVAIQALRAIAAYPELWRFLDHHTASRATEAYLHRSLSWQTSSF